MDLVWVFVVVNRAPLPSVVGIQLSGNGDRKLFLLPRAIGRLCLAPS